MKKPAIFMDAFLTDDARHEIFNYNVSQFIKHDWDVFIISNKISHFGSFTGVKYFEYDSTNRVLLNRHRYKLKSELIAYTHVVDENGTEYRFDSTTKSHGFTNWTLLYNMRKMALTAKRFGHTHFITCEYDVRFKDYNLLNNIFKGFGDTEKSKRGMIIKHGGYGCLTNLYLISVDLVLEKIPEMETEHDYEFFLRSVYGGYPVSPVFEQLIWEHVVEYTDANGGKNMEVISDQPFFDNIEEWGVFISEGDLGLRQGIFFKNLVVTPVNNNTSFFIKYWHGNRTTPVFVEYSTDQETQQFLLQPGGWKNIPCEGRKYVRIKTSESVVTKYPTISFDLTNQYNATLVKVN